MDYNPFNYFNNNNQTLVYDILSDDEVDYHIAVERNQSIHEINRDIEDLAETWTMVSSLVEEQGENINIIENQIQNTVINTEQGVINLERANEYVKDKIIIIRDISIVVGGGILGAGGFLLGPLVGIGTVIAGSAAGGAVVTGLHKARPNKK